MGNDKRQYIHNLAKGLMGKLGVSLPPTPDVAWRIYAEFSEKIESELRKMTPETRGRIADCGLSYEEDGPGFTLYEVHRGPYLDKFCGGRQLVTEIACTTVVAAMADITRPSSVGS